MSNEVIQVGILTLKARPIDWAAIERDYCAGILSLREIAGAHGITHGAVNKRAKRDAWARNLAARIHARADELVSRTMVSSAVSSRTLVTDNQIVEANAVRIAQVRAEHRTDINRMRCLGLSLLAELEAHTAAPALLHQLGDLMRSADDAGSQRLNDLYRKIISASGRVDTAKKLVETMRTVVSMEREAYGFDKPGGSVESDRGSLAALLATMKRSALPVVYDVSPDSNL